ncbi:MAG: inorganic pyrophosphatase [Bacteroidetes bacterium]|nr:MAG: inorganic pyrophosphatase [Bacteroidota bacterium]
MSFQKLARFLVCYIKKFMATIDIVVETPKGSAQKYDYEAETHFFKLSKILPSGMIFPFDFGFIPETRGADGDPIDIIMISELASFPGCKIKCRLIGGFKAKQSGERKKKMVRNDRYFAVPECSVMYKHVKTLKDLPAEIIKQVESFFIDYNKIEEKEFKVISQMQPKEAEQIIHKNRT